MQVTLDYIGFVQKKDKNEKKLNKLETKLNMIINL